MKKVGISIHEFVHSGWRKAPSRRRRKERCVSAKRILKKAAVALSIIACTASGPACSAQLSANWSHLRNPVLSYPHWSIKDPSMAQQNAAYFVFFSAFYQDHGRLRSHVVEVGTRDFRKFSRPMLNFTGEPDGWFGMCTPDIQKFSNLWVLTFNSWGDNPRRPDQLFYKTSSDLVHWSPTHPLAPNLTTGLSVIGPSITRIGDLYYASWRQGTEDFPRDIKVRIASAKNLDGPWSYSGSGDVSLRMVGGIDNDRIHENGQFIWIDNRLHMVSDDYRGDLEGTFLYSLLDPSDPLSWGRGYELQIPVESFNRINCCEAASLYDWRRQDGYFYIIYDGANEQSTYEGRGWKSLGLARSRDLVHWFPAGSAGHE